MRTTLYLTAVEYDRMVACGAFDGLNRKVELIRGQIFTMNPADPIHDDYQLSGNRSRPQAVNGYSQS